MTNVSRNDIYVRSEHGGETLDEFYRMLKGAPNEPTIQDLLNAINNRRSESVEDVVARYREETGLDLVLSENKATTKVASGLGPIAPMKLKKIETPEELLKDYKPEDLIVQGKIDGWKCQAIKTDVVRIYSRRGEEKTENVPVIIEALNEIMPPDTFILGELAWVDETGKQSIGDIQTVLGSNPDKAQQHANGKLIFYAYDLLWLNGKELTQEPYNKRYEQLKAFNLSKPLELVKNYAFDEWRVAVQDALKVGGEGIAIKAKNSTYNYGTIGESEKTGDWWKFKPSEKAKEADVIVKEYREGKGKLIFPAYQRKGKELFEVGQVSGLPEEDEARVKELIDAGKQVVLEVGFQDIMESGKFRHMGYRRTRFDKPVKEVKMAHFISKRHKLAASNIVQLIEQHPDIIRDIDSLCSHSGGHKPTHSIINFLREKLGRELISYSDKELIDYIEGKKFQYKDTCHHRQQYDAGSVGIKQDNQADDQIADYYTHAK